MSKNVRILPSAKPKKKKKKKKITTKNDLKKLPIKNFRKEYFMTQKISGADENK